MIRTTQIEDGKKGAFIGFRLEANAVTQGESSRPTSQSIPLPSAG